MTKLEAFIKAKGIMPARLAQESEYSRQHLLRVRMERMEPPRKCIKAIVYACRRLGREPVKASELFDLELARRRRFNNCRPTFICLCLHQKREHWDTKENPQGPVPSHLASTYRTPVGASETIAQPARSLFEKPRWASVRRGMSGPCRLVLIFLQSETTSTPPQDFRPLVEASKIVGRENDARDAPKERTRRERMNVLHGETKPACAPPVRRCSSPLRDSGVGAGRPLGRRRPGRTDLLRPPADALVASLWRSERAWRQLRASEAGEGRRDRVRLLRLPSMSVRTARTAGGGVSTDLTTKRRT
jgi:hypothetical protein